MVSIAFCWYLIFSVLYCTVRSSILPITKRQALQSTCGYQNGDSSKPRTANSGFHCTSDNTFGLWGYCPNSVSAAGDCGFYGRCTDVYSCTSGCGKAATVGISVTSCGSNLRCSTDLLVVNQDTFTYVGCGSNDGGTFYAVPTSVSATTTSSARTSSTPSPTSISSSLPTPTPTSTSSASVPSATGSSAPAPDKPSNIGPIVGGILGGLAIICLTLVALFLPRRIRSSKEKQAQPPAYMSEEMLNPGGVSPNVYKAANRTPIEMEGMRTWNEPSELEARA